MFLSARLTATTGFAIAVFVTSVATATAHAANPPKIEYIEVDGLECLHPKVNDASANLADYRAAESLWLATKYPGVKAPNAETIIELSPAEGSSGRPKQSTVKSETFHLDGVVGPRAVVCFDINLTTSSAGTQD